MEDYVFLFIKGNEGYLVTLRGTDAAEFLLVDTEKYCSLYEKHDYLGENKRVKAAKELCIEKGYRVDCNPQYKNLPGKLKGQKFALIWRDLALA